MSDAVHHHAARVIIDDDILTFIPDEKLPNVIMPIKRCRIITVNGEIWEHQFMAFNLTQELVLQHWDNLQKQTSWKRINPNEK
jgi:hypothetical protein